MSIARANTDLASWVVSELVARGVRRAVLSPGSRNTPLVLAFDASPIETTVILDERVAGFVALGISRAAHEPVALCCTSGSAGAHYLPALIEARYGGGALVALTADRPAELQDCGASQTIAQARLFGEQVAFSATLDADVSARAGRPWTTRTIERAMRCAVRGEPVHLNVRFAKPLWDPEVAPSIEVDEVSELGEPALDPELLDAFVARARRSERGAIVCGPSNGELPPEAIGSLARALGWPVFAEPTSGLRFVGATEVIATYDVLLTDGAPRPDLVVRFGMPVVSKALSTWMKGVPHLVVAPHDRARDPYGAAEMLLSAPVETLCKRAADGLEREPGPWLELWRGADALAREVIEKATGAELWEGAVAAAIVDALPPGSALQIANSLPVRDLGAWVPSGELDVFSSRGAAGIDGGIATALGLSLARPGRVAFVGGELSVQHDAGGLLAARALDTELTVVMIRNGGGGIFRQLPIAEHPTAFERYFLTPPDLDAAALAHAAGLSHTRVESLEELRDALASPRGFVEVVIDPARDRAVRERVGTDVRARLDETEWAT